MRHIPVQRFNARVQRSIAKTVADALTAAQALHKEVDISLLEMDRRARLVDTSALWSD